MLSDIESSVIHLTPSKALQEVIDGISRAMRNYGEIECAAAYIDNGARILGASERAAEFAAEIARG